MVSQNVAEIIQKQVTLEIECIDRMSALPNHYYFYLLDEDFGPLFIKFCSYLMSRSIAWLAWIRIRGGYLRLFGSQYNAKEACFGPGKKEDDPNAVLRDQVAIGILHAVFTCSAGTYIRYHEITLINAAAR